MNKKGVGFPELFVLAVLITLPFVLLAVSKQLNATGRSIGAQQVNIFRADVERDLILSEVDKTAQLAFEFSLEDLAEKSGFIDEAVFVEDCAVLNSKDFPETLVFPDLSRSLNYYFSNKFADLNKNSDVANVRLISGPYELFVQSSIIRGIPLGRIYYSFGNILTKELWTGFSFKPSFKIIRKNELSLYPQIFERLKLIYDECKSQDLKACSGGRLLNDAFISSSSEISSENPNILLLKFSFKEFDRHVCYGLYFPKRGIET